MFVLNITPIIELYHAYITQLVDNLTLVESTLLTGLIRRLWVQPPLGTQVMCNGNQLGGARSAGGLIAIIPTWAGESSFDQLCCSASLTIPLGLLKKNKQFHFIIFYQDLFTPVFHFHNCCQTHSTPNVSVTTPFLSRIQESFAQLPV